jgi:hypothetical protein
MKYVGKLPKAQLNRDNAKKEMDKLVKESIPTNDFFMNDLLTNEGNKAKMTDYLMKVKEECAKRLLDVLFHPEHGDMDCKYWLRFGKKDMSFLGRKFNNSI